MGKRTKHLRTLLISGLALASVALLALVFRSQPQSETPTQSGPDPSATAHEPAAGAGPARPSATSDTPTGGRVPALDAGTPALVPGSAKRVQVQIVRADTRAPVPDAQVWCWPRSAVVASDGDFDEWLRRGRVEEHLAAASSTRSDLRGEAQVADQEQGFVIAAAAGELWGCASFPALRQGAAIVALAPDLDLRVQVVDAQGAALAGVAVALQQHRGSSVFERMLARTQAPDGVAILRHAGHFLRTFQGPEDEFAVRVQALFDPLLERKLLRGAEPTEPIRFVLPPNGSCAVTLVDASGESVGGACEARLRFAKPPGGPVETLSSRSGTGLVFEHVELGRELLLQVKLEGVPTVLEARGPGPQSPGERIVLRPLVGGDSAILRGRVLDPAGAPVRERELCARIESGAARPAAWDEQRVWTTADGRFALQIAPRTDLAAGSQLALGALAHDGAELAVARLALPPELPAGSYELGDCVLPDPPLAAAGRVVDESGNAIAGALVTAEIDAGDSAPGRLASALSDETGRFEIRGEAAGKQLSLQAAKQGLVGSPVSVRAPASDLRLVLGSSGTLAGRVLLDPSLQRTLVLVQVERAAPAGLAGSTVLSQDGSFSLQSLVPETYSLRVVYASNASELARIEDLRVRAGENPRDPRLDPLDLRAKLRLLELELVDELDRPIAQARAYSRPSAEAEARWSFAESAGTHLLLLSDGRPLDVAIAAEGFFRARIEGLTTSRRLTLQRAAQLRLELARGVQLPQPPLSLGVELTPLEAGLPGGFGESRRAYFGPDGVLTCSSACAGALSAQLLVERRGPWSTQSFPAGEAVPRTLQVAADSSVQVFTIGVDPAALAAAIESARNRN